MKPKRQEDSSCVFAYRFVAALAIAAIPQEKKTRRSNFGAEQEEDYFKPLRWHGTTAIKGEASSRPVCRSQSAAPAIRGIVHPSIRRRADHRTPAEPSAAEFSGLVSATAPSEQGMFAPCGSVLTWHK